ncbi:TPA: DUF645 family protein, partial [Vibrio cholerae]|nr:DUF645 family protein [Vibrio cholerae]
QLLVLDVCLSDAFA